MGINAQNHDASVTIFDTNKNEILFAAHAERYSHVKNDKNLNREILIDALSYCGGHVDEYIWYEDTFKKKLRYLKAGQYRRFWSDNSPEKYLGEFGLNAKQVIRSDHHLSHAAGSYYTSGFNDAAVVVIDAIGEFSTTSIFEAKGRNLKKIYGENYPNSIGLFYSAITQMVGLKPNEEEYILMGMAAYGIPERFKQLLLDTLVKETGDHRFKVKHNMHKGVSHLFEQDWNESETFDLAAGAQSIVEDYVVKLCEWARKNTGSKNLVLSGGVALNCVANSEIAKRAGFENIWILPNPGDAGNSLGAILNFTRQQTSFASPYLGYNIDREFNTADCVRALCEGHIVGVASGRAEFGPRALGNRSLLADPRGAETKRKMNDIKKRQKFRPFAPVILEQHAHDYFDLPVATSQFMQFTAPVKNPEKFPAICHVDNTARVQTVNEKQNKNLFDLLTAFYNETGCPMLVNTSLNIKGEPLVNTWDDAIRFSNKYKVEMF